MKSARKALPWLVVVLLAFAAWRVLSLGMADHYATTDPERALGWRADHPLALLRAADEAAEDPVRADEAADFARRALHADPLDGRPYRVLARLAAEAGDEARAAELYGLAVRRAVRDRPAHGWLIDYHLRNGRPAEALAHLDTLLRLQPNLSGRFEPLLVALAGTPPAQPALVEVLQRRPPWRPAFLRLVATRAPDVEAVTPVFDALRRGEGGLDPTRELGPWLDRLVREGRVGQAYLLWAASLPPERQRSLGNVFNGDFEHEPLPVGFDWRFGRVSGARISRMKVPGSGDGGMALRVAFEDRRVPFSHVRQLLALPPGDYRLSLRARADGLRSERGLVWEVTCLAGGRPLTATPPLRGHGDWQELEVDFTVPEGCQGQWLVLKLPARIPAEQRIGGRAWFDDLRIRRVR